MATALFHHDTIVPPTLWQLSAHLAGHTTAQVWRQASVIQAMLRQTAESLGHTATSG
jgi:hypothetical protein